MNIKKHKISLLIVIIFAIITGSCERDDICAEATPTTPRLFVEFYDNVNLDELKPVRRLRVIGLDANNNPVDTLSLENANPTSVLLPLRIGLEGELTTTRYILEKDSDLADDEEDPEDPTDSTIDIIEINYTPQFVYVSRACGYKSIFEFGLDGNFRRVMEDDDETDWIRRTEIAIDFIENEDEAQVYIFH